MIALTAEVPTAGCLTPSGSTVLTLSEALGYCRNDPLTSWRQALLDTSLSLVGCCLIGSRC